MKSIVFLLEDLDGKDMITITNKYAEMTYSYSRSKMLDTCARSYYYNYYASNGGWRQEAAQRTKLIYRLKKLQALNSVVGVAIHSSITDLIVNSNLTNKDFKRLTNTKIRECYSNSLTKKEEWIRDPKIFQMIQEVYFFGKVDILTQQKVIEKIEACAGNLIKCKSLAEIKSDSVILTIDELKDFVISGCKAFVKIDALYQKRDTGEFIVVDWKSGKGSEIEVEQLLLYVYFVHKMYDLPVELIEARLEYMLDGDCASYRFTSADMMMAERIINNDINKMQKYLFNAKKNIPQPETYFTANMSAKCRYCNFQEVCFGEAIGEFKKYVNGFSKNVNVSSEIYIQ
jgi:CRISPR/Cas system-associated exonuclease Cas4 (RecB family)